MGSPNEAALSHGATARPYKHYSRPIFVLALTSLLFTHIYLASFFCRTRAEPPPFMAQPLDDDAAVAGMVSKHPPSLVPPRLLAPVPLDVVPTAANGRRLVFIGDIHGMIAELDRLLADIAFNPATDHLVACGDMVNKGTDSPAVIARLMQLGASAVRGNHEEHVLNAWVQDKARGKADVNQDEDDDENEDLDAESRRWKEDRKHRKTARSLSDKQLRWLAALPVIHTFDPLPIYAVHGGLVPGVNLHHQQPWAVMNMRTLLLPRKHKQKHTRDESLPSDSSSSTSEQDRRDDDDEWADESAPEVDYSAAVPIDGRDGVKWTKAWNTYQKHLSKHKRRTVVYGHDAKRGYRKGKYTFGLDSNCVGGGSLTALVVEATKHSFKHTTVQVECKTKIKMEE
jgi:bis(5'-nucleosyl)-tetraphosphatase (symmetrical)